MIEDRKLVALPRKPAVSQVIPLLRVGGFRVQHTPNPSRPSCFS